MNPSTEIYSKEILQLKLALQHIELIVNCNRQGWKWEEIQLHRSSLSVGGSLLCVPEKKHLSPYWIPFNVIIRFAKPEQVYQINFGKDSTVTTGERTYIKETINSTLTNNLISTTINA